MTATEKDENAAAQECEHDNAVGVDEPSSDGSQDVREIVILRNGAAEPGEIGECCIGRQREHDQD